MDTPRLVISYVDGRTVTHELTDPITTIGRRGDRTVQLTFGEVSRTHAEITREAHGLVLRDTGSRHGTFVNGKPVAEHLLRSRDQIQFGRSSDCRVVFLSGDSNTDMPLITNSRDFRLLAAMLESVRALGPVRVLDDVLALVVDSAIELTGAERGFIMLAGAGGGLEFKIGRRRGRVALPGSTFKVSRKIPSEVYATGRSHSKNLTDEAAAQDHVETKALEIGYVVCVPLILVRFVERPDAESVAAPIGVLYLDSQTDDVLTSPATQAALEALAGEAAVAIESARLCRDRCEKERLERELEIAAQIQHALMPQGEHSGGFFEVAGAAIPCRAIGGDFFDYLELEDRGLGVALGDVSGKGPAAALLTAAVQGMFTLEAANAGGPAVTLTTINRGLNRRNLQSRFVTMFFGVLSADGRLVYCNGGHNAPVLLGRGAASRLETGGTILGLFEKASYEQETLTLESGDTLVVFSDGISDAQNPAGEDYGEDRLIACLEDNRDAAPAAMRETLLASVRAFASTATQSDDMTVLILRYRRR